MKKIKISYIDIDGYEVITKVTHEQLRLISKVINITIL